MKFSILFVLPAMVAATMGRAIPECAKNEIIDALAKSGCPLKDFKCVCNNSEAVERIVSAARTKCSNHDRDGG
jgi:hypothetical protein